MSEFIVKFSEDEDSDQTSIEKYMWLLVNPLFSLATWVFQDKMKQFCFLFFCFFQLMPFVLYICQIL